MLNTDFPILIFSDFEPDNRLLLLWLPLRGRLPVLMADGVEQTGWPLIKQERQVQKPTWLNIESRREYVASLVINDKEVVPDLIGIPQVAA